MSKFKEFLFHNVSPDQTLFKNIFWLASIQISRLLRVATIIYAIRIIGVNQYGLFSYMMGLLGFLTIFSDIGTGEILTRNIAKYEDKRNEYFATGFWLKIFLIFLTSLIIIVITPYISKIETVKPLVYFTILFMFFDNLREFMLSYIRGLEKMQWEALIFTIINISLGIFGFFLLSFSPTAKNLLLIYILSSSLGFLTSIILSRKILPVIFFNFRKTTCIEILKDSWPLGIIGLFGVMYNLDIVMLGWWRTAEEIGLYGAGQKIVQILSTLPIILTTSLLPTLSSLVKENNSIKEKAIIEKVMTIMFMFTIPIIVIGIVLGGEIIQLVYGEQYTSGTQVFKILIANTILIFPNLIIYTIITAHNIQRKIIKYVAIVAFSNFFLNILFIPHFGIIGSATATFISEAIGLNLIWRETKKVSYFETITHLKKIIIASVIVGFIGFIFKEIGVSVITNIVLSSLSYFVFLLIAREKTLYEFFSILKLEKFR